MSRAPGACLCVLVGLGQLKDDISFSFVLGMWDKEGDEGEYGRGREVMGKGRCEG